MDKVIRYFLCLQRKIQQNLRERYFKRILFQFPHGNRQDTSKCPPCSPKIWASHRTTGKAVLSVGFKFIVTKLLAKEYTAASSWQREVWPALIPLSLHLWALCVGTQGTPRYKAMLETCLGVWGAFAQPLLCVPHGRGRWGESLLLQESLCKSVAFVVASGFRWGHFCTCWEMGVTQFAQMIQKFSKYNLL